MEGEVEVPAITAEEAEAFARMVSVEGIFRGLGGCGPFGNRLPGIGATVVEDRDGNVVQTIQPPVIASTSDGRVIGPVTRITPSLPLLPLPPQLREPLPGLCSR